MKRTFALQKLGIGIFALTILAGCFSVRLISDYDEVMDKTIAELHESSTRLLINVERNIGTEKANYSNYVNTYENMKVKLNVLDIRAAGLNKNRIIKGQLVELRNTINNMEKLHKIGFYSTDQLKLLEQPLNSLFGAMTKLQMALKRGEKQPLTK